MSDAVMLSIAFAIIAAMFGVLCAVLGWLGNRIYNKVDEMSKSLNAMAGELHARINGIDRRVTIVETKCSTNHDFKGGQ